MPLWERWKPAFDDRMPIYRQIILMFSQAFVRGDIEPGERIPSIREMSALLKVNTNTMQRAYQEMERDTLINSKRGTGYFYTEDLKMIEKIRRDLAVSSQHRFLEEMRALGGSDREIIKNLEIFIKKGVINGNSSGN
ncbi:MAG: GntR family transcriptional regulator [Treponema sp.]|nr:GntR family transcriptional regulator [Treponema sp.]